MCPVQFAPFLKHFHYWSYCLGMLGPFVLNGNRVILRRFSANKPVLLKDLKLPRQYTWGNGRKSLLDGGKVFMAVLNGN